ncbi:MAG: fimbrillin family protein [Rikenellaceae bacterium]|nr:fimbrillin family protein [Rikenellaceae bacterium]
MKRFLFAAVAAVLVASCATDRVKELNRDEINLGMSIENATRGVTSTTQSLSKFNVYGFHDDETLMMTNVEVTKQADGNWATAQKYFWPTTGSVDFYAYATSDLNGHNFAEMTLAFLDMLYFRFDASPATTGAPAGYTIPAAGCILPATIPELLYATALDEVRQQTKVPMNFRRALAEVEFAAKNNSTSGLEITFGNYITVDKLYYAGKYYMPTTKSTYEDFEVAESHGHWMLEGEPMIHVWKVQNTTVNISGSNEPTHITGAMQLNPDPLDYSNLVLPQSGTYEVTVPVLIKQNGLVLYDGDMEFDIDADWEEGYRYIYTLVLNDDTDLLWEIKFEATVDNIRNGGTDDIRVPDGTEL